MTHIRKKQLSRHSSIFLALENIKPPLPGAFRNFKCMALKEGGGKTNSRTDIVRSEKRVSVTGQGCNKP